MQTEWIRAVWRVLRTPASSFIAVVVLALGITATTAVYSVLHSVLGPPPGVEDVGRVVNLELGGSERLSPRVFNDLKLHQRIFPAITAWGSFRRQVNVGSETSTVSGEIVDGGYFRLLGTRMAMGRPLLPSDDVRNAELVATISFRLWQSLLGGDPAVIGRQIRIGRANYYVVGVTAQDFRGLVGNGVLRTSVWIPLASAERSMAERFSLDRAWLRPIARISVDQSMSEATSALTILASSLSAVASLQDRSFRPGVPAVITPITEVHFDRASDRIAVPLAWAVMILALVVFLVCTSNVATVIVARSYSRRRECALRFALGAPRWRLVSGTIAEGVLIGLAATGVAILIIRLLASFGGNVDFGGVQGAFSLQLTSDPTVMLFAALLGVIGSAAIAIPPAVPIWRSTLSNSITSEAMREQSAGWRGRRRLIASQVAVSVAMLAVAGLCSVQVWAAKSARGLDLSRLYAVELDFDARDYTETRVREVVERFTERFRIPDATAIASGLPGGVMPGAYIELADATGRKTTEAEFIVGSPSYLDLLRIPIVAGRGLTGRDGPESGPVAVLSSSSALELFGGGDPLGKQIVVSKFSDGLREDVAITVVGVAADIQGSQATQARRLRTVYVPISQHIDRRLLVLLRAESDQNSHAQTVQKVLREIDPDVVVAKSGNVAGLSGDLQLFHTVAAELTAALGAVAVLVVVVGLYGAVSTSVRSRTREMGIRMALGADRRRIVDLIVRQALVPIRTGLLIGLVLALFLRFLAPIFVHSWVSAEVGLFLLVVPGVFLAIGVCSSYWPARRAASLEPNVALRDL